MSENINVGNPFTVGGADPEHNSPARAVLALFTPDTYQVVMRRGGALMIDSLFWAIAIGGLAVSVGRSTEPLDMGANSTPVLFGGVTFQLSLLQIWSVTSLWIAYLIVSEWRFGATVGKKAVGISVVRSGGEVAGPLDALLRQVPRFVIISLLMLVSLYLLVPLVFLVEALVARSDDQRRRVGDRLAGTVVVRTDHLQIRGMLPADGSRGVSMGVVRPLIPGRATAFGYRAYAGLWQRAGAVFVDGVVLLAITFVLAIMPLMPSIFDSFGTFPTASSSPGNLFLALVGFGYYAYLNGRGATLGKMLFGIQVIDDTGRPPGLRRGAIRQLIPAAGVLVPYVLEIGWGAKAVAGFDVDVLWVAAISLIVVFAYFLFSIYDGLSMLWNEDRQTIHDRMAGTFVVRNSASD